MKIVLSDINNILFPENYANRKDPLRKQKEYLMQTERDNYLEGLRNIKFVVKITKLSFTIEDKMTRVFVMELYEKLINISFGWDKEYNWHELKPILMFFTVFANTNSIRDLELRAKNPNTHRMMDKYMFIKNRG